MTDEQEYDPQVIAEFKATLMKLKGVQAIGESIANGKPCLKIHFLDESTMTSTAIPETIGIPVVKVVSGTIHSQ